MKILATIAAREGSIRLKNKNILPFCGKPLIAWSILQALSCKYINDVYLNTDSEEYAEIGREYGAKIIMREKEESDVTAGVPTRRAVKILQEQGLQYDAIFALLPTGPLRKPGDFDRLVERYMIGDVDGVGLGYTMPECVIWKRTGIDTAKNHLFDKNYGYIQYCFQGIGNLETLMKAWEKTPKYDKIIDKGYKKKLPKKPITFIKGEVWQVFDIDDKKDFEFCELLFQHYVLDKYGEDYYERKIREIR